MKKPFAALLLALACLAAVLPAPAGAQTLNVGGTGSSGPLVQLLFEAFRKEAPGAVLHLSSPPLGTNGALKALALGRIELALAGRPLRADELGRFGRHFDLAATPFVLASSGGAPARGLGLEQLAGIYAGATTRWSSGAPIRLVLRPDFDADTLQLKSMGPALEKAVGQAARRPGMAMALDDIEAAQLIDATPGSLGPTTLGLLKTLGLHPTVLPLNGVAPSLETLRNARYPWRKILTVILPTKPSPMALRFADFLRSPAAREILLRNDYLPAAP